VLTGYPGVMVHAGVLHDFPFPVCGCDACDETAETTADGMELLVLTVVAGGYSERYPVGSQRWRNTHWQRMTDRALKAERANPAPSTPTDSTPQRSGYAM
jgi:hypothetical protein